MMLFHGVYEQWVIEKCPEKPYKFIADFHDHFF